MTYNILWTGGWDSTFRVAELLLLHHQQVSPIYIHDPSRPSVRAELEAIDRMRRSLIEMDATVEVRLAPLRLIAKGEYRLYNEERQAMDKVLETQTLGGQYVWISHVVRVAGIHNVEMCVHRDDLAHHVLEPYIQVVNDMAGEYREVRKDAPKEVKTLFGPFRLPVFELSKVDMERRAEAGGFLDVMEQTWFCHRPNKGKPCGICNPCKYTRNEGLGRRVPEPSRSDRIRYHAKQVVYSLQDRYDALTKQVSAWLT